MKNPIVFGVAIFLSAVVMLTGFVFPRGREIATLERSISRERSQLDALDLRLQELRSADPAALGAAAAHYRDLIPSSSELPEFLALLELLATQSGVSVSTVSIGAPSAAAVGPVTSIGFNVSATGDYFSLAKFLFALEHAPRLIRTGSIGLAGSAGKGLSLTVSIIAYTTDPSAGPGSDPAVGPEVGA